MSGDLERSRELGHSFFVFPLTLMFRATKTRSPCSKGLGYLWCLSYCNLLFRCARWISSLATFRQRRTRRNSSLGDFRGVFGHSKADWCGRTAVRPCTNSKGMYRVNDCRAVLMDNVAAGRCSSQSLCSTLRILLSQKRASRLLVQRARSSVASQ